MALAQYPRIRRLGWPIKLEGFPCPPRKKGSLAHPTRRVHLPTKLEGSACPPSRKGPLAHQACTTEGEVMKDLARR